MKKVTLISMDNNDAERLVLLSQLYEKGNDLFGNDEKFTEWLNKQSYAYSLYGKKPIDLLDTIVGINKVYDELIKIEFGDFS